VIDWLVRLVAVLCSKARALSATSRVLSTALVKECSDNLLDALDDSVIEWRGGVNRIG
jgi:hypothetical protein